ncbi:hypothetical protein GYB57_07605 [bacterium]|nr:hypothetical protein [bacterium]
MNKGHIEQSISELLYQFDCVIIPDFGGFVTNYSGARIQSVQNTFSPPSKRISFNRNLTVNDGLLANYLANRHNVSFIEARKAIDEFVNATVASLGRGEKVKLEKIGMLYLDVEKNLQFLPDYGTNYLLDTFGMSNFKAIPIERPALEERIQKEIKERLVVVKAPTEEENKKRFGFYWAAAASVFIFMGIGYMSYKYQINNDSPVSYASLGLKYATPTYTYQPVERVVDQDFEDDFKWKLSTEVSEKVLSNEKSKVALLEEDELHYHVVGGCFSSEENAEKLYKRLQKKGYAARMVGTFKNLHTVSYSSFKTREEAVAMLDEVKNTENTSAWLLEK